MGVLEVFFEYFGFVFSMMKIKQTKNSKVQEYEFEYSTDVFQKYLVLFLQKHIETWSSTYAFNGEEIVIDFYNEIIENGKMTKGMFVV